MRKTLSLLLTALLILTLTGCAPQPLPEGLEEDAVIAAGQEIAELLVDGSYEETAGRFREDIPVEPDTLRDLMEQATEKAGVYLGRRDSMASGRTIDGVEYAEAAILCQYKKDDVLIRVCFDTDMVLVGLEITKQ